MQITMSFFTQRGELFGTYGQSECEELWMICVDLEAHVLKYSASLSSASGKKATRGQHKTNRNGLNSCLIVRHLFGAEHLVVERCRQGRPNVPTSCGGPTPPVPTRGGGQHRAPASC